MNDKGWIKNHRKVLDNPIVCKDADHFAVWNYLLLMATHSEYDTLFGKKRITLKPGQVILGREMISEKFNISQSKVQRILKLFKSERMIEQITYPRKGRIITILNWDKYQASERINDRIVNEMWTNSERIVNGKQEDKELKNVRMIDAEKFIKKWNENFKEKINQSNLNQSINQLSNYSSEEIFKVLDKATKSNYLLGLTEKNNRGLTLHFFTKPNNFEKIKNGAYDTFTTTANEKKENKKKKETFSLSERDNRDEKAERQAFIEMKLKQKLPIKIKNKEK